MLGEIFGFIYIIPKRDYPLLANYLANGFFISIIIYYKIKGANDDATRAKAEKRGAKTKTD